jgi:hypothetical protein
VEQPSSILSELKNTDFFWLEGQFLLLMLDLIEQVQTTFDYIIDVV